MILLKEERLKWGYKIIQAEKSLRNGRIEVDNFHFLIPLRDKTLKVEVPEAPQIRPEEVR